MFAPATNPLVIVNECHVLKFPGADPVNVAAGVGRPFTTIAASLSAAHLPLRDATFVHVRLKFIR